MQQPELEDVRRALGEQASSFAARRMGPERARRARALAAGFEPEMWKEFARLGWLGIVIPEAFGGSGLGFGEMTTVARHLGGALMPEPLSATAVLAARAILHGDNGPLKQEILPALCAGELVATVAWQERHGELDPSSVRTAARFDAGAVTLTGRKQFVPHAPAADAFVVSAVTDDGIGLYWIPANASGVRVERQALVDESTHGTVTFDGVRVQPSALIASPSVALNSLRSALDEATVTASAELLGIGSRSLEITLDYLRNRSQFGRPIGAFQALQHRAVDLYVQQELTVSAVEVAARALDAPSTLEARAMFASRAKARSSDFAASLARDSIQMHGAVGWTDECDASLYVKRALVMSAWLGNAAAHRRRYASLAGFAPCRIPERGRPK